MIRFRPTRNSNSFVQFNGALLWLQECQPHNSPVNLFQEKCYYNQDDVIYVDPISRKFYSIGSKNPGDG